MPSGAWSRRLRRIILGTPRRGKYTVARRLLQLTILVLFSIQALISYSILMGSLASSRILKTIPLMDPFAWLEQAAATHSPTLESVIAVLVVFTIYSILGRFFCGWVCPMDLLFSLFERKLNRLNAPLYQRPHKTTKAEKIVPPIMMIIYLLLSIMLGRPFFTTYSPVAGATKLGEFLVNVLYNIPGATMGLVMAWSTITGFALIVNIIAEYVFGIKRFWCRFVCPIGNLYGFITNKYSPFVIKISKPEKCVRCNLCSMVCPMSIDILNEYIEKGRDIRDHRCFHCARCVEACPYGVLSFSVASPSAKRPTPPPPKIRGPSNLKGKENKGVREEEK
ncbi:quinol dehydrogenase ferredoxin subunit NapH [Pyrofollis japonicus]|uniref:4Fe-4S binding protein n=1 Tax=Pyrofollis japonicus TaxID=3060460 RepID=UPI00295AC2EB|nr:4Fe-4S binding protein [Pyrofollis japonicus]BEP17189.1 quinol dehydrogenase ferredoxin subunit NapH [Pyrofollis japonicus]